jgi:hypothetical protein
MIKPPFALLKQPPRSIRDPQARLRRHPANPGDGNAEPHGERFDCPALRRPRGKKELIVVATRERQPLPLGIGASCKRCVNRNRRPVDIGAQSRSFAKVAQIGKQSVGNVDRGTGERAQRKPQRHARLRPLHPNTGRVPSGQHPPGERLTDRQRRAAQRAAHPQIVLFDRPVAAKRQV